VYEELNTFEYTPEIGPAEFYTDKTKFTYSVGNLPEGISASNSNGKLVISGTPQEEFNETTTVTISYPSAEDKELSIKWNIETNNSELCQGGFPQCENVGVYTCDECGIPLCDMHYLDVWNENKLCGRYCLTCAGNHECEEKITCYYCGNSVDLMHKCVKCDQWICDECETWVGDDGWFCPECKPADDKYHTCAQDGCTNTNEFESGQYCTSCGKWYCFLHTGGSLCEDCYNKVQRCVLCGDTLDKLPADLYSYCEPCGGYVCYVHGSHEDRTPGLTAVKQFVVTV
jgi:hypothetical protein